MRRPLWLVFGFLVAAALAASAFVLLTPKIGTATRAEVEAALPASLKVHDAPDLSAEARYARIVALVSPIKASDLNAAQGLATTFGSPPRPDARALARLLRASTGMIDGVGSLLREGGVRFPTRSIASDWDDASRVKAFSKLLALAAKDAAARGDHAACARFSTLGLRYARALGEGKGVVIDGLVGIACVAIATRAVYEADTAGGLDATGRARVLVELPVGRGDGSALAESIRRDFQEMFLPVILDPKRHFADERLGFFDSSIERERLAGTFDPLATARLTGAIYVAAMVEATGAPAGRASRLADEAGRGLPQTEDMGGLQGFGYRLRMNTGRNTLGRKLAAQSTVFDGLGRTVRRAAANVNLARAVLLLRMGRSIAIPDPLGTGNLRVDLRRRIVWSVGEDGKDDGGAIGAALGKRGPDLGYRY